MADVPHFDFPFRIENGTAAVVEQDTLDEIQVCVINIVSYPLGYREELPEFGIEPAVFATAPIDISGVEDALAEWEPRTEAAIEEYPDLIDDALRHIDIQLSEGDA